MGRAADAACKRLLPAAGIRSAQNAGRIFAFQDYAVIGLPYDSANGSNTANLSLTTTVSDFTVIDFTCQ